MSNRIAFAVVSTLLAFASMGEEGPAPQPNNDDKGAAVKNGSVDSQAVKASQTEFQQDSGTKATTQDAQQQTNRAPNNEAIPETKKDNLPEHDSDGAPKK